MAVVLKQGIYVVSAKRTVFGRMRGALRHVPPSELLAAAAGAALRAGPVPPAAVDTVNVGQVFSTTEPANAVLAHRHAALKLGLPAHTPVMTVNRVCSSGFQAVVNSAQDILTGMAKVSLAGGAENTSMVPFLMRNFRFGTEDGIALQFEDWLASSTLDTYCDLTMGQTAENLAEMYKLTRRDADAYAYKSQQKWQTGFEQDAFKAELVPITVDMQGVKVVVENDEHPQPDITMESLAELPAIFKNGGVGTAGNSAGMHIGAGAILLASEDAARSLELQPLARLVGWSTGAVDPELMGLGVVPAVRTLLAAARCTISDVDMIEINEPFAGQALASALELKVDPEKLNVNGGAIAIGYPPAASGARITAHLTHELRRRGMKIGLGTACAGGGQGVALLLETV